MPIVTVIHSNEINEFELGYLYVALWVDRAKGTMELRPPTLAELEEVMKRHMPDAPVLGDE